MYSDSFHLRKFADIGHIANQQYSNGSFNICSWSDLVTALPVPGEGVITGLKSAVAELHKSGNLDCLRGCFLVVEMSSTGNHPTADYIACKLYFTCYAKASWLMCHMNLDIL
jgi:orotidine-5'-phosphate decarboxylase